MIYFDQKIQTMTILFWVLVFSIRIQYFAYPTNRSLEAESYN